MPYSAKASRALARESGRWLAVFAILGLAGSASASAVFRYTHFEHKCVNGFNIVKHASKTVAECAVLCDANPGCYGFEYGVDHGEASTTYSPEDCQLSSSADTTGCTGYNLDFYAKGESMLGEHHHLPECGSPGAGAQCACPPGTLGPLGGGDGAGGPCAPAECGSGRSLSNRTWSSVFNGVCGAATASVVDNYGVECWDQCGGVQGPCSFCGIGYCCRNDAFWDDTSNGCDGSTGIPGRWGHVHFPLMILLRAMRLRCTLDPKNRTLMEFSALGPAGYLRLTTPTSISQEHARVMRSHQKPSTRQMRWSYGPRAAESIAAPLQQA